MYQFATLFDKNYLTRGVALYQSMKEHIDDFTLYVLALDQEVVNYINKQNLENFKVINLADIEKKYPELLIAKNNRSLVEYYFTLSPFLPSYILENYPEIDFITTLDADIYFYNSPKPIFDEFEKYSIMISAHDFSLNLINLEIYGKYNVSFQSFRNDSEGLSCLKKWKRQCLEWCYDILENEKFADQKYLDTWCSDFKNTLVLSGKGAGIAPWNISKHRINKINNEVYCDDDKLIFYHFQGLRFLTKHIIIHGLSKYSVTSSKSIKNYIYKEYLVLLSKLQTEIEFKEQDIPRINNSHSLRDKINKLKNNQAYYNLFNIYLINNSNTLFFKVLKNTLFLPYKILKKYV